MKGKKKHKPRKVLILNSEQKKAMNKEINRQILENDKKYSQDFDAAVLWTLRVCYGFGKKRIRRFWDCFLAEHHRLRECYENAPDSDEFDCKSNLKKIGVDLDVWYKEYENNT